MGVVYDTHAQFERFALRVAGDDVTNYNALMRGRMSDFVRMAEVWLERMIEGQRQVRRNKHKH